MFSSLSRLSGLLKSPGSRAQGVLFFGGFSGVLWGPGRFMDLGASGQSRCFAFCGGGAACSLVSMAGMIDELRR